MKVFLYLSTLILLLSVTPLLGAPQPIRDDLAMIQKELEALQPYVRFDETTGLQTFDRESARTDGFSKEIVSLMREVVALQNDLAYAKLVRGGNREPLPELNSALALGWVVFRNMSQIEDTDELAWLVSQTAGSRGISRKALLAPVDAGELFAALFDSGLTMEELAALTRKITADSPDFLSREVPFQDVRKDFPGLSDEEILDHLPTIRKLYRRNLRHELLLAMQRTKVVEKGYYGFDNLCADELVVSVLYPEYVPYVLQAKDDAYALAGERFGPDATDTKEDAFRHPMWNVMIARYISTDPDVRVSTAIAITDLFTTAHESCHLDDPVHRPASKMDLHNNQEGLDYFASVADDECIGYYPICFGWGVTTPSVDVMQDHLFQGALDGTCVSNIDSYSESGLRSSFGGSQIFFESINGYSCSLPSGMTSGQWNVIFGYARGNTYSPASRSVYFYGTPTAAVQAQGTAHNQDSDGYVRTMVVRVNGTAYTTISWLTYEETESFSTTIPASAFHSGWNTIEAYVHWGNSAYDDGHWVSLMIKP